VAAAHATADGDVVAEDLIVFDDGDEAEVVGEDVHVVHGRDDEGHLEFARQVGLAVERVDEVFVFGVVEVELDVVDPDGVVGARFRGDLADGLERVGVDGFAGLGDGGRGGRGDVAVDVAAGREGGEEGLVDFFNERAEAGLHDAVELDALAGSDAKGVVAVLGGEVVEGDPLVGRHDAAGDAAADHHDVFLAGLAEVAVVLLVNAVEFGELLFVVREAIEGRVGEGGGDGAGEGGTGPA